MSFDNGIYPEFTRRRVKLFQHFLGLDFFKGKTVLEVGCGYGYAGELLEKLGATVTSLDARQEHIDVVRTRYPHRCTIVSDLNGRWNSDTRYDVIFSIGLLYHLEHPLVFFKECSSRCTHICLETIVCDLKQPRLLKQQAQTSFDQATTTTACVPSPHWIKKTLQSMRFKIADVSSSIANVDGNRFDWNPTYCGDISHPGYYLRKAYIAKKTGSK